MALAIQEFYRDLMTAKKSSPFPHLGANFDRLAEAVSFAIPAWAVGQKTNLLMTGIAVGTAGAGTINPSTTKLFVVPNIPAMLAGLNSAGMNGPMASALATVLSIGISSTFLRAGQYIGTAAGVGVGTDASVISSANVATLVQMLLGHMIVFMGPGPANSMMAQGIARGIVDMLIGTTGVGSVVGTPGPAPGTGPTTSVVF